MQSGRRTFVVSVHQLLFIVGTLVVPTTVGQSFCTSNPCPHNTYCFGGTENLCVQCNAVCNGCTTLGTDGCIECIAGYQKVNGACEACPAGRYGTACNGTCNCLQDSACNTATGACAGLCNKGYYPPPDCTKPCPDGFYGLNCLEACHCWNDSVCDKELGFCPNNLCHPDWASYGCSKRLPKLINPPTVLLATCDYVTVRWNRWSLSFGDIGDLPVMQYRLYALLNGSDPNLNWTLKAKVDEDPNVASYSVNVTSLQRDAFYRFRVDVHYNDDGKVVERTSPGTPSELVKVPCSTTTSPAPVTIPIILGADIFTDMTYSSQSNASLVVTWSMNPVIRGFPWNVSLSYQLTGIGDCSPVDVSPVTPVTTVYIDQTNTSFSLSNPGQWRRYGFTLHAQGTGSIAAYNGSKSIEAVSAEVAPTGNVSNIQTTAVTKDSVTLQWVSVPCPDKGGVLLRYDIHVNTSGSNWMLQSNTTSVTINNLTLFTAYSASVRYVNRAGAGPLSDVFLFKTAEGAPGSVEIRELVPTATEINVTFDPPVPANGIVLDYQISYSTDSNFSSTETITVSATSAGSVVIRRLSSFTQYYVKVRASTAAATGPYGVVKQVRTLQARPFPPSAISLDYQNTTCLGVTWVPPDQSAITVTSYAFNITKVTSGTNILIVAEELAANVIKYLRCGLDPGRAYVVSIVSRSGGSPGDAIEGIFYTEQGNPPQPPPPRLVSINTTSAVIEIEPVTLTEGPLSAYQIEVETIQSSNRRKRHPGVPGYVTAQLSPENVREQQTFKIGDGLNYGGFANTPLVPGQQYQVYYVVLSTLNNVTKYSFSQLPEPFTTRSNQPQTTETFLPVPASSAVDEGVLIGIIVGLILLIIIIICVILIVCWRRRRQGLTGSPPYFELDDASKPSPKKQAEEYDPEKNWNQISSVRQSRFIVAGRECLPDDQVAPAGPDAAMLTLTPVTFRKEFHTMPHVLQKATTSEAQKYPDRNRFPHILAYDHTRVPLAPDKHAQCPYINANFVSGYKRSGAYIAAQSPFDDATAVDFWRMIQQHGVRTVVMIANVVEDDIVKCTQFWPQAGKVSIGGYLLELFQEEVYADFTIRDITVQDSRDTKGRIVRLFEFTSWPDHGVPDDPIPFLDMRYKIRQHHGDDAVPILVHCGTGVARTGVFIAADALIDQYAMEGRISVFAFVRNMRKERPHMVRTYKQYVFIYECIFEEFHAGSTLVDVLTLRPKYHGWTKTNRKTGHSFLRDQFHLLHTLTRGPTSTQCATASQVHNAQKNRYPDVVPPDAHRPELTTPAGLSLTDYINGVFVDSYRLRNRFILTQTPLHTTIVDFWRMVYDHRVQTVVMMESFKHDADDQAEYWPSDVSMKQFEPFFIEMTAAFQQENVTVRNFKVRNTLRPKDTPRYVRQFQFNGWADTSLTPVSKTLAMDLIDLVFEYQEKTASQHSPVVVHCQDGATHSGLFVALSLVMERLDEEQEVDVYHVIKHIKRRRPKVLADYDQYRFVYKSLWDYMNLRMPGGMFTDTLGQSKTDRTYGTASLSLTSYQDSQY